MKTWSHEIYRDQIGEQERMILDTNEQYKTQNSNDKLQNGHKQAHRIGSNKCEKVTLRHITVKNKK